MRWSRSVLVFLVASIVAVGGVTGCAAAPDEAAPDKAAPASSPSPSFPPFSPSWSATPSVAPPCTQNQAWTQEEQTTWLKGTTYAHLSQGVALRSAAAPLCRPIPVQVEYWLLTWASGGSLKTTSVSRQTVGADGRGADMGVPAPVSSRDACAGALVAAYAGTDPLQGHELPRSFDLTTNLDSKGFSQRVVAHYYAQPMRTPPDCPVG